MTFKLDIFGLLSRIGNAKAGDIYASLSDDEKKGFAPLVVMRWMSGSNDMGQIITINEYANKFVFPLAKHPHLLMLVLQACSSKSSGKARWIGIKGGSKKTQLRNQVLMDYFEFSANEIRSMIVFPTNEEIVEMAEELGWQKDEVKKLQTEQKNALINK